MISQIEAVRNYFEQLGVLMSLGSCSIYNANMYFSDNKLQRAVSSYAPGANCENIIGVLDNSVLRNMSQGVVLCQYYLFYRDSDCREGKIWYEEIKSARVENTIEKISDPQGDIIFHKNNGSEIRLHFNEVHYPTIIQFVMEMARFETCTGEAKSSFKFHNNSTTNAGSTAGGVFTGNYDTVNRIFEEEKFHGAQGHGFAAERANNLHDRMAGKKAKIVGDDNAKDGADRVVNGTYIQSKYCASGKTCIRQCF